MSVFTHIEAEHQLSWIKEIHRILSSDGIFLFTIHGKKYVWNLNRTDLGDLKVNGAITKSFSQKGHRMMTTYNTSAHFREMILSYFIILEFYDGIEYPCKTGGQDLWIVPKATNK